MRPFPLKGHVPIAQQLYRIQQRRPDATHGWIYTLRSSSAAQEERTQAEVIASIAAHARYQVGQWVRVDAFRELPITERHWLFGRGITVYHIRMPSSTAHRRRFAESILIELELWAGR